MRIGVVAPGHFKRLAAEVAFLHAWYRDSLNGFPPPDYICGVSAGGIAAACAAQWTEEDFKKTEEVLIRLRRSDFYSVNSKLKVQAAIAILSLVINYISSELIDKFIEKIADHFDIKPSKLRFIKFAIKALPLGVALISDEEFVRKLLTCDSVFSNDNLYKLLFSHLNFRRIFNSPIKVDIASADVNKKKFHVVTNYKPEHMNGHIFTQGIVDSTRLPVFFPFREHSDGAYLADGAGIANAPIELARTHSCDIIVVLNFRCNEGLANKKSKMWISDLQLFIDRLVDENSRKAMRGYLNVNNDLEQLEIQNHNLEQLRGLVMCEQLDPNARMIIGNYIKTKITSDQKLSYANKRKIKFITVDSEELPEFHFSSFNPEQIRDSTNKGYNSYFDSFKPQFNK